MPVQGEQAVVVGLRLHLQDAREGPEGLHHRSLFAPHLEAQGSRPAQAAGEVLGGVLGHHPALVDDHHPPAGHLHLGQDVGGEHDRVLASQALDQLAGLDDLLGVEARGGLVEDEHVRVVEDGLGEAHPLAVALRELADEGVAHVAHPGLPDHVVDLPAAILGGDPLDLGAEAEEVQDRHVRVEGRGLRDVADPPLDLEGGLEDVVAPHPRGPVGGRQVAGEDAHRRGLPGPVGAQEAQDLPLLDAEGDPVDRGMAAVPLGEVLDLDHE